MYLKHKYNISNTYKSFVRYFQIYRKTIKFELYKYESHKMIFSEEDVEDYVEYRILKDLDDQLFSILSIGEKMAIEVLEKRKKEFNPFFEKLIKDIYDKWLNVFFSDYVEHYHKLNSHKIGLKMKLIREANDMNKTELALRLNVNRKTITLLEDGERLPSLECIYNFCKIFDYSIEKMLS